jgi:hypothetical protein
MSMYMIPKTTFFKIPLHQTVLTVVSFLDNENFWGLIWQRGGTLLKC